ncbi:MAG: HAMP domain-containing protein [Deltaproteobacteria bacterium]|nr:HAMP domain-containing protein [Deltaproteobacteria bacterium]MBW2388648.1 HAMP domain-containing protein [Deltaproteobacteria bacterium]
MPSSQARSIRSRLGLGFLKTTGVSLFVVMVLFVSIEFTRSQNAMTRNLSILSAVIGMNTVPALLFDDPTAAEETLSAFTAQQHVLAAVIYDADGNVFARYSRADMGRFEAPPASRDRIEFDWFGDRLDVYQAIRVDGDHFGTVFIRSDTREMRALFVRLAAAAVGAMLLASLVAWFGAAQMQEDIATPLAALVEGSEAMSRGDLSTRVEIAREDEIGTLADTFNAMVTSLRGLVAQVGENTRAVSDATVVLRGASDGMRRVSSRQEVAVEESAESIEKMTASIDEVNQAVSTLAAEAHDTSTAAVEMDGSIVEIAAHMDELSQTIDSAASSIVQMTAGIREIAQFADTLKNATETTSTSLQQLSSSVGEVEENAKASQVLSAQATDEAERGMRSVQETVDGMKQIQDSFVGLESVISRLDEQSKNIGNVLGVIEGVVEQTNLLALNAAIISSHAGEHGRAFAVVAEEVKNLSDRTAGSTREISRHIGEVQQEIANAVRSVSDGGERVDRGVALSREAGEILKTMAESARLSHRTAKEIVQATGEQASGLQRVDLAMVQVRQIAKQLSRGTHEQDNASAEITRGVERMRQLGQEVKRSTHVQRTESRHIAQSVEIVASRSNQILAATNEQSKQSEQILESLKVFREVTVESARRAEEMKSTVDLLSERAGSLDKEVGRFSL